MDGSEMKIARFSSCRGVPFEINPNRTNPFAIEPPPTPIPKQEPTTHGSWLWLPWTRTSSFEIRPWTNTVSPARSRASSHFCDIDIDADKDDHDDDNVEAEFITEAIQDVEKQQEKKANNSSRLSIILLDQGFTVYKWIFLVCLALNMVALSLSASGHFPYAKEKASLFSIANILALTLCRSEATLRILFYLVAKTIGKPCVPLRIKTSTTSFLQNLGGIHSSCAVSSISWLLFSLVLTMKNRNKTSIEIIVVAFAILSLLLLSSLAAFPLVRQLHHNVFERTHRFAGWTALILLWLFILLSISFDPNSQSYHFTISKMIKNQESWFTLAITILIVIPWLTVRRVPVRVSAPSSGHATIIKFEGGVEAGLFGRISPSPLSEWHAFGIISDGKTEHMMLAGAVGDFTRWLVSTKPTHLWVRKLHFAGLTYLVKLYKRVLLVATGSGVCVFLSFLLQKRHHHVDVYLIWVAKDIESNFGKEIVELVRNYPKEKVIVHDTGVCGRPNVAEMSVEGATLWNCEVVIVTSNPQCSRDVVRACKRAKIPAFGPIWDS